MIIERIRTWNSEAELGLCYAIGRDREELLEGVNAGRLELFRLWAGEAYMVTRVERGTVTVCCYQGARLLEAAAWLVARARELGLRRIRCHVTRPAIARLVRRAIALELAEQVFEAEL